MSTEQQLLSRLSIRYPRRPANELLAIARDFAPCYVLDHEGHLVPTGELKHLASFAAVAPEVSSQIANEHAARAFPHSPLERTAAILEARGINPHAICESPDDAADPMSVALSLHNSQQ